MAALRYRPGGILGAPYQIKGAPGQGTHQGGGWADSNAYDLYVPKGTPVYAVADGTIGSQIGSLGKGGRYAGLRLHLVVAGNEFYYAHLSKLAVKAGQRVKKGQLLGYSGEANGVAHLHFAAMHGDPRDALNGKMPEREGSAPQGAAAATAAPAQMDQQSYEQSVANATPNAQTPVSAGVNAPPGLAPPGSVDIPYSPRRWAAESWQTIAAQSYASPDTLRLAEKAKALLDA